MTHGYPEEVLRQHRDAARSILNAAGYTAEERAAAQSVLDQIEAMDQSGGSMLESEDGLAFTAPRNFTGGNLYYRIRVYSPADSITHFTVDISVQPEADPLATALSRLEAARSSADRERQSQEPNPGTGTVGDVPGSDNAGNAEAVSEDPGFGNGDSGESESEESEPEESEPEESEPEEPGTEEPGAEGPGAGDGESDG